MTTYHIIYPSGDHARLKVLELTLSMQHELDDYALASREVFYDPTDAQDYAIKLASKHGKVFVKPGHDYLD